VRNQITHQLFRNQLREKRFSADFMAFARVEEKLPDFLALSWFCLD